jgi:phosphohistidine swiveling domain-containing protein
MRRLKRDMLTSTYALSEAEDFDGIFARGISAVDTKFRGTHSHFAIRARELGTPEVIGAGEKLFKTVARTNRVTVVPEDSERRDCLGPAWPRFILA